MHWVIQDDPHMDQGSRDLLVILDRADISHSLHKVVPFIGELVPDISPDGPVIVIGSYSMRHVAREKGWTPGSYDLANITHADHIAHWGQYMLNADAVTCRFEDALVHLDRDEPNFIRPSVDSKFFAGGIFDYNEFEEWWNKVVVLCEDDGSSLRRDTEIIIASPKHIMAEYRTWVVDGSVVTASLYKRGGRVIYDGRVDEEIIAFAQARTDEWQPKKAFVLDIAQTDDGLRIVETNTINAAGFYAADVFKLVSALENATASVF